MSLSKLAKTLRIFQLGFEFIRGFTTGSNFCFFPSRFTKVPDVSEKGEMGNITDAYSLAFLKRNGLLTLFLFMLYLKD